MDISLSIRHIQVKIGNPLLKCFSAPGRVRKPWIDLHTFLVTRISKQFCMFFCNSLTTVRKASLSFKLFTTDIWIIHRYAMFSERKNLCFFFYSFVLKSLNTHTHTHIEIFIGKLIRQYYRKFDSLMIYLSIICIIFILQ